MRNPDPEAFANNIETIEEHFNFLSAGDRKYINLIIKQMEKKPVQDFNRKQFNMVNEIARKLRSKVRRVKKNQPGRLPES